MLIPTFKAAKVYQMELVNNQDVAMVIKEDGPKPPEERIRQTQAH